MIDAAINAFESGFVKGGQTKEHAYLLRSLGVKTLIIGVNKMDLVKWDQSRFCITSSEFRIYLECCQGFFVENWVQRQSLDFHSL